MAKGPLAVVSLYGLSLMAVFAVVLIYRPSVENKHVLEMVHRNSPVTFERWVLI